MSKINDNEISDDNEMSQEYEADKNDISDNSFSSPSGHFLVLPEDRIGSKRKGMFTDTVVCTACSQRLDAYRLDCMRRHPILDVLLCKRCYLLHSLKEIQVGEDGMDEACRWCALEGDLICCDFCHNVFCKLCIRRNLGRTHLNTILNAGEDEKWQCYVCNSEPLSMLVGMCSNILQAAEENDIPAKSNKKHESTEVYTPISPKTKKAKNSENIDEVPKTKVSDRVSIHNEKFVNEEYLEENKVLGDIVYYRAPNGEVLAITANADEETPTNIETNESVKHKSIVNNKRSRGRPKLDSSLPENQMRKKSYPKSKTNWRTPVNLAAVISADLSHHPPRIDEQNVWPVVEKLLAATQSMTMLMVSLKEDLKRMAVNGASQLELKRKRKEISYKLWRAFIAYKKSFIDIEEFTRENEADLYENNEFLSESDGNKINISEMKRKFSVNVIEKEFKKIREAKDLISLNEINSTEEKKESELPSLEGLIAVQSNHNYQHNHLNKRLDFQNSNISSQLLQTQKLLGNSGSQYSQVLQNTQLIATTQQPFVIQTHHLLGNELQSQIDQSHQIINNQQQHIIIIPEGQNLDELQNSSGQQQILIANDQQGFQTIQLINAPGQHFQQFHAT